MAANLPAEAETNGTQRPSRQHPTNGNLSPMQTTDGAR
jgi:hypothetical protein